jgi:multidrug efflux pump subunit AcrB
MLIWVRSLMCSLLSFCNKAAGLSLAAPSGVDVRDATAAAGAAAAARGEGMLLSKTQNQWAFLGLVTMMLMAAMSLVYFRFVVVKMLPFDNKSEFQVIVDMPEGTTLERTTAAMGALEEYLQTVPEVVAFETYAGVPSPMDFNGWCATITSASTPTRATSASSSATSSPTSLGRAWWPRH